MKPVDQTQFEDGKGNCLAACLASILELNIEDVPELLPKTGQESTMDSWLASRGYQVLRMHFMDEESLQEVHFANNGPKLYCILSGISPRKTKEGLVKFHATVGEIGGYGVKIVHDPHPSRTGLEKFGHRYVEIIIKAQQDDKKDSEAVV